MSNSIRGFFGVNVFNLAFYSSSWIGEKRVSKRPSLSKLVLDVLKPHVPDLIDFCRALSAVDGVSRVSAVVVEVDVETDTVKITVEGNGINFEKLRDKVKEMGAAVHSIDEVVFE
ncbi:MAG TPA: hypothetical protein ENF79_01935 [Nitrososphaeria archaeon]|nr:hypothetical protein [Nitrososphaeria archaeon]